jgi:hypothetical protein
MPDAAWSFVDSVACKHRRPRISSYSLIKQRRAQNIPHHTKPLKFNGTAQQRKGGAPWKVGIYTRMFERRKQIQRRADELFCTAA